MNMVSFIWYLLTVVMESFSEVVYLLRIPSLLLDQGSSAKSSKINGSLSVCSVELA